VSGLLLNLLGSTQSAASGPVGGIRWITAASYTWTCPADVTSVCVLCVGAGGSGGAYGGSGGSLAYKNNVTVTPGQNYTIVVGATNLIPVASPYTWSAGDSSALGTSAEGGEGGYSGTSASVYHAIGTNYDGGGRGGLASTDFYGAVPTGGNAYLEGAGGGAGGYAGDGGTAGKGPAAGTDGSGGGGGGGAVQPNNISSGGGGVGLFGQGANGAGAAGYTSGAVGGGGSGGANGTAVSSSSSYGGQHGGGSGALGGVTPTQAQCGAVRIIWGAGRSFPNTLTSLSASAGNETEIS